MVFTERTIRLNDPNNKTMEWSYGQTLSLVLLYPQVERALSVYKRTRMANKKLGLAPDTNTATDVVPVSGVSEPLTPTDAQDDSAGAPDRVGQDHHAA
ncbi:hypothetical protein RHS04_03886 [Rhizoctonia solani]|nr:hypothetical protein RHS04_03886 [Rhizoctonia solani]